MYLTSTGARGLRDTGGREDTKIDVMTDQTDDVRRSIAVCIRALKIRLSFKGPYYRP
jgi:hypothetical protein